MIQPISQERWQQAQEAERKQHKFSKEQGISHYRIAYGHNFRYLGIDPNEVQRSIIEIGCADFPALLFCDQLEECNIIEPMASPYLKDICKLKGIYLSTIMFEDIQPDLWAYEIWMFNVLQHTKDPERIISKAKEARCIRYFEPIDTDITSYHPHTFTIHDFDRWFPEVNQYYNTKENKNFHDGPCCYGVWTNPLLC